MSMLLFKPVRYKLNMLQNSMNFYMLKVNMLQNSMNCYMLKVKYVTKFNELLYVKS